jgi:creatinine amidohydrolase
MAQPAISTPLLWDELSSPQAAEIIARKLPIILPCGATEQHGRHLPLSVDTLIAYELAKRVSARTGVPLLPPLWMGSSARHGDFPGTVSVQPTTFVAVVCDIVRWLYRQGLRQFIFFNTHSWNTGPLETARDTLLGEYDKNGIRIKLWDWWYDVPRMMEVIAQETPGRAAGWGHGGLTETSQMLYLRPDLVNMKLVENFTGEGSFWNLRMDEYAPHGIVGRNAVGANVELGRELIDDAAATLADVLLATLRETTDGSSSKSSC